MTPPHDLNSESNPAYDDSLPPEPLAPPVAASSFAALKDRIRHHYELASEYYYTLWGEHIHHGYFLLDTDTKERAQIQLIELLIQRCQLPRGITVLDVGCGIGGTSRWLASNHDCHVTGITISGKQVEMATKLTQEVGSSTNTSEDASGKSIPLNNGSAHFLELDAETMGEFFAGQSKFDCVWISEAMSHLPDKKLFFRNAFGVLQTGGKLVVADWFRAESLTEQQVADDIKPIEDGMLLPPLCTQTSYAAFAREAGFGVFSEPFDISDKVAKTW
ncbi:MAG: hypothetical protein Q9169_008310 [Polycauliona sp. 2 TL-2023]